ncbi:hypothetical protein WISP_146385 [Willisornis vidua]|uniref:Uncharacterized protein n=1 Tax=Willisornis vidua TaxID=1566151 RepID=A0ABQ9CKL3_9PASS|nr:hypothetical protein WISP_146385 [Willisornis vidua]
MKLNHLLLRCHRGRKDQRVVRSRAVAEEEEVAMNLPMEGEEVTITGVTTEEEEEATTHHMEGVEVMNREAMIEGDEEDVVVMIMVAEEVEEETSTKEAGQMAEVVATRMAATGRATTEMEVFKQVATMVVAAATKEEAMVATSHLLTLEVATKGVVVVATSKTTDTKMVGPTVTEGVGVEEGGVAVAVVVAVEVKEAAGGAEVGRTSIKEGSLSSTSSMEVISITNLALDKEDTSPAEAAKNLHFSRAHIIETWFQRLDLIAASISTGLYMAGRLSLSGMFSIK